MALRKSLIAGLSAALFCGQVLAWGQTGHRVTGEIAEKYLTDNARTAITNLLGVETLAQASTWPDEMRSNPSHFWQKEAWRLHFTTVPDGKTYADVGAPEGGDAMTALSSSTGDLLDKDASVEEKQLALRFIVHIIGDLHQPLHVGNGTDKGGNDFKVEFFWDDSNLHRVWDSGMIDKEQLSFTEWTKWLNATITDKELKDWAQTDPEVWMAESQKIRMEIYPEVDTPISWTYKYQHLPTVKLRLKQAGVRIAHYLNEVYSK